MFFVLVNTFLAITRKPPGFPKPGHGLDDMELRCVKQCRGTHDARRRDEMRLIFHHGTLRPHGLNVDFILKTQHSTEERLGAKRLL